MTIKSLVPPLLLILSIAVSGSAWAKTITIKGTVKTESGNLVKGGTLIFYEYEKQLMGMPDVKIRAVHVTDRSGEFNVQLKDVKGAIDINLVKDKCEWKGDSVLIQFEQLKGKSEVKVDITPPTHVCN